MIVRALTAIERVFAALTAVSLMGIMIVVCIDVLMRYLFNAPISWVFDAISLYALAAVFYLSVSRAFAHGDHVRIDVVLQAVPRPVGRWMRILQNLLALPVVLLIAWFVAGQAWTAYSMGLVLNGPVPWPTWPTPLLAAIGMLLLSLRLIIDLGHIGDPCAPSQPPAVPSDPQ
jgi:TRAP-type C4-dicarboxylate transport system permease small subunit